MFVDIASLQKEDGSVAGDEWGEIDIRFSYCAVSALSLLKSLDRINTRSATTYILKCRNFDGGFGSNPDAESHGALVWCAIAALKILDPLLDCLQPYDNIAWWLAERQLPCGGFNGRPEKKEDVCYSWWVYASLIILGREDWIDRDALKGFIEGAVDEGNGGIADRKGDQADLFHTLFGVAAYGFVGGENVKGWERVDARYCMTRSVVKRVMGDF